MIARQHIASACIPGGGELRLYQRGAEFTIALGGNELMSSRMAGSEQELALMTLDRLRAPAPHLLLGGYGMGFSLRAALGRLEADARVSVAELVPEIIAWARGPLAHLTAGCLDDARVTLIEGDVAEAITAAPNRYDAIMLDVDNGPDGLSRAANDRLYSAKGLAAAKAALRRGGVLAIWSAGPDARFRRRLNDAGFEVEEKTVRARAGKGARHVIWFARR